MLVAEGLMLVQSDEHLNEGPVKGRLYVICYMYLHAKIAQVNAKPKARARAQMQRHARAIGGQCNLHKRTHDSTGTLAVSHAR